MAYFNYYNSSLLQQISTRIERQVKLIVAVLTNQTALKLVHGKTRNPYLRCSSTGAGVDISWRHYRYAWRDSDDVIFVPCSADGGRHFCLIFGKATKLCVAHKGKMSSFFYSNVGVRQGENLSALLFAIYSNGMEDFFRQHNGGTSLRLIEKLDIDSRNGDSVPS